MVLCCDPGGDLNSIEMLSTACLGATLGANFDIAPPLDSALHRSVCALTYCDALSLGQCLSSAWRPLQEVQNTSAALAVMEASHSQLDKVKDEYRWGTGHIIKTAQCGNWHE